MRCLPASRPAIGWVVSFILLSITGAGQPGFTQTSTRESVAERALKYHELLVRRPEPGYLFDRFYNTWLDESTVDALETYLSAKAEETRATPDQLLLAFFYVKKGDDVAALERFQQALATNPASAATWYYKALAESRTLDFDSAIADLKKARAQSPDEKLAVQIDKQLGKLLVRNRQTSEALEVWQALLKVHPDDDELHEDLIDLHIDEGLLKEASQLTEALIARTKDPYLLVMRRLRLGDIHNRAGDREQAIADYTSALDDVGSESWLEREILAQMEQVHRREDDITGLKRLYDNLVRKYPKRIAIRRRQAHLLVEQGDHEPAIAAFREVMRLTPGDRATREEFVQVLATIGRHDDAVTEQRAICEQFPKDAELQIRLANLLYDAKKSDEATAAVDAYLSVSDGSEYAHLRAARQLERFENRAAAAKVYADMANKFADSPSAQEAYAAFLYSNDQKDEALARWQAVAEEADVAQLLHVARALAVRNEHAAALRLLRQRETKFAKEPLFLGQLVSTACALKEYDEAIPWARARVELAESVNDLEAAIDQAATVIERAERLDDECKELASRKQRSVPETCLLAELLERTGDSRRADAVLKELAESGNLLALSEQIRLFSQRREWSAAADATRRILDLPEGRKSLYVRRLVELYQRDYQLEEALRWVDEWKRLSPGSTTPWVTEARMLNGLGRSDDALKVLRTAVLRFEDDDDLRIRLAEFYTAADKPADAQRIYWQLYEQTEDTSGKLRWAQGLAKIAQQQGTVPQLVDNFNERVASNRRSIVPLLSLSEIYRQTDNYEGRRRALTAASKIKPDDIYLLRQIARVAEQEGDWKAAIATLERAIPLDKTNRTREQIAQLHLRNGDEDTGLAMLMELTEGEDADPRAIEAFADTLCEMWEWERAAEFLQKRIVEFPEDYRLRYLMAVAMEEAGQSDPALEQFVLLLDDQQELPSKAKKGGQAGQQLTHTNYYDMMRELMPTDAIQWFEVMQYRYTAYSHRQRRSGMVYSYSSASGMVRSAIQLPANVDAVRPMALSHALGVISTWEEDGQQDAARVLETHGVHSAEIWCRVDPMRGDITPVLIELLEKNPKNEMALAILVIQRLGNRDATLAPHCRKAVEVFRKSRPQLALMAAVQAGGYDGYEEETTNDNKNDSKKSTKENYLDEALEIARSLEKPNPIVVMGLTQSLGGNPGSRNRIEVDDDYRRKFSQLLVKWYPSLTNSPYGSYAFYMVVNSLSQNDDPMAYVQFLDDEVSRSQTGGRGSRAMSAQASPFSSGRNRKQFLAQLTFPPTQLADFPSAVLMLFSPNPSMNPFGGRLQPLGETEEAATKLKPLVDKVKSPILRVLIAHSARDEKSVDEGIAKLLAAKTPSIDAYLLAAGHAAEKEDHQRVVELLGKARYLPMAPAIRQQIDSAVVAAVIALKTGSKPLAPELLDAGQQASLRLRRARLDAQQRNELIAAMEDLGLKKEAKKLDELASQVTTPSVARRVGVVYSGGKRATPQDRISKMVAEGKREAAAKLLASDVSAQVQQAMSNPVMRRNFSYQYRQLKSRIEGFGLADAVLKELDPGETRNFRRINEYAMALEVFGRTDDARAQYQRALKIRPKDDVARMELIMLLAESDPAAATAEIHKLSRTSHDAFGQMLGGQFQDYESSLSERIAAAGIAVEFIKTLKPGDITQPYWVENILNMLGRRMHMNRGGSMPSLYVRADRIDESRRSRAAASDELIAKRAQVHRELCLALLENSDFARSGFRHLLAATAAKGAPTDEFEERAKKLLLDEAKTRPMRMNTSAVYYNSNEPEERFLEPEEFLAARAWKSGGWSLIDETILPGLSSGRARESRKRLQRISDLYRCDSNDFIARAEEVVREARSRSQRGENEGLTTVVNVWAERNLDVDLRAMVLKQLKIDAGSQNSYHAPRYLVGLIDGAADRWDRAQQLDFLDKVSSVYIAPPGKRNDFLRKYYQRNRIVWGTPSGRIYVFRQFMQQLCQQDELLFVALEHLQQYDQPMADNLEYRVREQVNRVVSKGPESTLEFLERSPWLQDLPTFQPLAMELTGRNSPLVNLVHQMTHPDDNKPKFHEMLSKRQTSQPTFGGGLLLACVEQQQKPSSVLEYLGEHIDAIRALSSDQQLDLAGGIFELVRTDALTRDDLSDSATIAQEWLTAKRAGSAQNILVRLEKAKRLEELGIQYGNVDDFLRTHVTSLIRTDTSAAVKVIERLGDLSREAQGRGEWHMYFGGGQSTDGWLLQQTIYGVRDKDWKTYNFIVDMIRNDKDRHIGIGNVASQVVSQALNSTINRAPQLEGGKVAPIDARVRFLYEELGKALAGRPASLIFDGFHSRIGGQLSEQDCANIRKWAGDEATNGQFPALAADLDAVVGVIAAEKAAGRNKRFARNERRPMADYHEHFVKLLDDDELPLSWRMTIAEYLARRQGASLPLKVAERMVRVYSEALAAKVPINSSQNMRLMSVVASLTEAESAKELLSEWGDTWAGRYLRPRRTQVGNQRNYERLDEPANSDAICQALEAYYALGSADRANTLLHKFGGQIGSMPLTLAVVVRADQPAEAAKLVRSNWATLRLEWRSTPRTQFDAKLAELLPAVYEQLGRDDLRYFAELFFASAPDVQPKDQVNGEPAVAATKRDERLRELANEYSEIEFADSALRRRALVLLSLSEATRDTIADEVAAEYKLENVIAAIQLQENQSTRTQESQFAACHLSNRLRAGDSQPLINLFARLNRSAVSNDYDFGYRVMPFITCLREAIDTTERSWSVDECTSIATQMRDFFKNRDYVYFNDFQAFNSLFVAMHARADNREAVKNWWQKLSNNSRNQMKNRGIKDDIWQLGVRLVGPPTAENLIARTEYVQHVLGVAVELDWIQWNQGRKYYLSGYQGTQLFDGVVQSGLMTREELLEHGESLVGAVNNVPLVTAAWAEWLLAGGEFEKARANWRWVIDFDAKSRENNLTDVKVAYFFQLARSLEGLGKFDEALAELAKLEEKEISGASRGHLARIKREIGEASKKAQLDLDTGKAEKETPPATEQPADVDPAHPAAGDERSDTKAAA